MMYKKRVRIFGPPNFTAYPIQVIYCVGEVKSLFFHILALFLFQRGEGLASVFGRLFRRVLPIAKKGIQKVANSKITKEIGNTLLNQGISAASDIGTVQLMHDESDFFHFTSKGQTFLLDYHVLAEFLLKLQILLRGKVDILPLRMLKEDYNNQEKKQQKFTIKIFLIILLKK